ncbi:MAG: hypothetical protein ACWA40_03680 [Planktomarina sp.]
MQPDILTRSETNAPASLNPEKRTVDAILSTGAGVPRFDFEGEYVEKLEISPDAIDLTRAEGGPVLDSHRQDGLDKVLGRLANVRIENGQLIGHPGNFTPSQCHSRRHRQRHNSGRFNRLFNRSLSR